MNDTTPQKPAVWTPRKLMQFLSRVPRQWMDAEIAITSTSSLDHADPMRRVALHEHRDGSKIIMLSKNSITVGR